MAVKATGVQQGSPACKQGLKAGDVLLKINGHDIKDVLDYQFYATDRLLSLQMEDGRIIKIRKGQSEDLGLLFDTYLMDKQQRCKNNCIFCFIDQLPKGMRESLYFKDDDSRLSFLFGNYITLTNITEHEISRILNMHISPVNISVHTTNPELRIKMVKNKFAGDCLNIITRLAEGGIRMNCQIVLCPGINDGDELRRTLSDLTSLYPQVGSIAVVPVGLSRHREGLFPLKAMDPQSAMSALNIIDEFANKFYSEHGDYLVYAADEFYLKAGLDFPEVSRYGELLQYENGVGISSLLKHEFKMAVEDSEANIPPRKLSLATGVAAAPAIKLLVDIARDKWHNLDCTVYPIKNEFFGEGIDVAGLVTGTDLIKTLKDVSLGEALLMPAVMFRRERDMMLDNTTVEDIEKALKVKVKLVENDGYDLLSALLGTELNMKG